MFNFLKEEINTLNTTELEDISLDETTSLEELICEAVGEVGEDMPMAGAYGYANISGSHFDSDIEGLQKHNQDHIQGMDDEDLDDIANPAHKSYTSMHESGKSNSLVGYLLGEGCDDRDRIAGSSNVASLGNEPYDGSNEEDGGDAYDNMSEVDSDLDNATIKTESFSSPSILKRLLGEDFEGDEEDSGESSLDYTDEDQAEDDFDSNSGNFSDSEFGDE